MLEQLKSQEMEKTELQEKINRLSKLILVSTSVTPSHMFPPISRRKHKKNSSTEDNKEESEEESEEDILSGDDDLIPPDIIDFDEDLAKLSSNIDGVFFILSLVLEIRNLPNLPTFQFEA